MPIRAVAATFLAATALPGCAATTRPVVTVVASAPVAMSFAAPAGAVSAGTGFFVRRDGVLVTAAHVVQGCRRLAVGSAQMAHTSAKVVMSDTASDLAVLRADGAAVPGTVAVLPDGGRRGLATGYGYGSRATMAALETTTPQDVTDQVRVPSNDPRFAVWWRDERIQHGWSGGPVLRDGALSGVILEVFTDLAETARVFGRAQRGIAAGAEPGSVASLLRRAGVAPEAGDTAAGAVVRVFCLGRAEQRTGPKL